MQPALQTELNMTEVCLTFPPQSPWSGQRDTLLESVEVASAGLQRIWVWSLSLTHTHLLPVHTQPVHTTSLSLCYSFLFY